METPRPESEAMIGAHVPADDLLESLRSRPVVGREATDGLGVPGGPNSGLTCRLPTAEELPT